MCAYSRRRYTCATGTFSATQRLRKRGLNMKKLSIFILSVMKKITMPLVIALLFLYLRNFSDILLGSYILFPLCYIIQAFLISNKICHLIITYIFSSAIFLMLTEQWYRITDPMWCILVYWILGFICYAAKKCIMRRKTNQQHHTK